MENISEMIWDLQGNVAGIVPNLTSQISQLANRNELTVMSNLKEYAHRIIRIMQSREQHLSQQSVEAPIDPFSSLKVSCKTVSEHCVCRPHIVHKIFGKSYDERDSRQFFALHFLSTAVTHPRSCPVFLFLEFSRSAELRFVYCSPEMIVSFIRKV